MRVLIADNFEQSGRESLASADVDGDALAHHVPVELSRQGPVRLRFKVEDGGHLYSFTLTD